MSSAYAERGYGQVEPNRLSGITFGNIEAQAPAYIYDEDNGKYVPMPELENGQFLVVVADTANLGSPMGRIAVLPGDDLATATDTPYLVFSERKQYDERAKYADFVDKAADKVDGLLYPRLVGLTPDSCVWTTNCANLNADPSVGDILYVGDDGYLTATEATNTVYQFVVTKVYTMPDGQKGFKVECKRYVADDDND